MKNTFDEDSKENKPTILVVSYSKLATDGRVLRQIEFLKHIENVNITVCAIGKYGGSDENITYIELSRKVNIINKLKASILLKLKRYSEFDPSFGFAEILKEQLKDKVFSLIVVNDVEPLKVAFYLKKPGTRILLDAHEYAPLQFEDRWRFRVFFQGYMDYLCKFYLSKVDKLITVSGGISDAYKKYYGVSSTVITNTPFFQNLSPKITDPGRIRLIYHGGVTQSRNIELLFDLIEKLDKRYSLDLMLMPAESRYYNRIVKQAEKQNRVRIINPVKPGQIAVALNDYDIGVYMMAPVNFNHKHALPNKLFEFIQARLAVAIWPTPGMATVVNETKCGIVSEDYSVDSLVMALNNTTPEEIDKYKACSNKAAAVYCADENQKIFCDLVSEII